MMRSTLAIITASAFFIGADSAPPKKKFEKSADHVNITASATKPDAGGKQTVTLDFQIDTGWNIYANPVGSMEVEGNKTIVSFAAKEKVGDIKIDYPAGDVKEDKLADMAITYRVYRNKVTIKASVQRAKGDASPLEVKVKVFACDKDVCLPGSTVKLTVP